MHTVEINRVRTTTPKIRAKNSLEGGLQLHVTCLEREALEKLLTAIFLAVKR